MTLRNAADPDLVQLRTAGTSRPPTHCCIGRVLPARFILLAQDKHSSKENVKCCVAWDIVEQRCPLLLSWLMITVGDECRIPSAAPPPEDSWCKTVSSAPRRPELRAAECNLNVKDKQRTVAGDVLTRRYVAIVPNIGATHTSGPARA